MESVSQVWGEARKRDFQSCVNSLWAITHSTQGSLVVFLQWSCINKYNCCNSQNFQVRNSELCVVTVVDLGLLSWAVGMNWACEWCAQCKLSKWLLMSSVSFPDSGWIQVGLGWFWFVRISFCFKLGNAGWGWFPSSSDGHSITGIGWECIWVLLRMSHTTLDVASVTWCYVIPMSFPRIAFICWDVSALFPFQEDIVRNSFYANHF